jgi:isocitrate dehydrogenase
LQVICPFPSQFAFDFEVYEHYFQLQVTPNLCGNLVANTAAGIAGGTGVMPGGITITNLLKL